MAKISTLSMSGSVQGDTVTESFGAFTITNAAAPGAVPQNVALASGANTLTVPAGAVWFMLVPPALSIVTKTLKGVTGDTGVVMAPALPFAFGFNPGTVSFVITASGAETVQVFWG